MDKQGRHQREFSDEEFYFLQSLYNLKHSEYLKAIQWFIEDRKKAWMLKIIDWRKKQATKHDRYDIDTITAGLELIGELEMFFVNIDHKYEMWKRVMDVEEAEREERLGIEGGKVSPIRTQFSTGHKE